MGFSADRRCNDTRDGVYFLLELKVQVFGGIYFGAFVNFHEVYFLDIASQWEEVSSVLDIKASAVWALLDVGPLRPDVIQPWCMHWPNKYDK